MNWSSPPQPRSGGSPLATGVSRWFEDYRFGGKGKKQHAGHNPLLKEGPPRRSKIVSLPPVIGAAGVVSHASSLVVLIKNPIL